ncbi:hypothetical protein ACFQ2K_35960 [Streptomyces sanglieri]|uniref:Uncharacterized protein n=2 Tax=Streptomyces TaxID=1883 RepID=A0ABW2X3J2_9ACTN
MLRARLRRTADAPPDTASVVEDGLLTLDGRMSPTPGSPRRRCPAPAGC